MQGAHGPIHAASCLCAELVHHTMTTLCASSAAMGRVVTPQKVVSCHLMDGTSSSATKTAPHAPWIANLGLGLDWGYIRVILGLY